MPRLVLGSALSRWTHAAGDAKVGELALEFDGGSVAQLLQGLFDRHPTLRGYILDEHGQLRHHLALFVDGIALRDKTALDTRVHREIYILQALSGG